MSDDISIRLENPATGPRRPGDLVFTDGEHVLMRVPPHGPVMIDDRPAKNDKEVVDMLRQFAKRCNTRLSEPPPPPGKHNGH